MFLSSWVAFTSFMIFRQWRYIHVLVADRITNWSVFMKNCNFSDKFCFHWSSSQSEICLQSDVWSNTVFQRNKRQILCTSFCINLTGNWTPIYFTCTWGLCCAKNIIPDWIHQSSWSSSNLTSRSLRQPIFEEVSAQIVMAHVIEGNQ